MSDQREFRLIVNKKEKIWPDEFITGAQIKQLAESPPDWVVNEIVPGPGDDPEIGNEQRVDLSPTASPHGIKKFTTRKPTTSPGRTSFLPEDDQEYLRTKGLPFGETKENLPQPASDRRGIVFPRFEFEGNLYELREGTLTRVTRCELLILIPSGYSTTKLDSFYTIPRLKRSDRSDPQNATADQTLFDRTWQFWSRHLADQEWRAGIDGLETYLQYVRAELRKA